MEQIITAPQLSVGRASKSPQSQRMSSTLLFNPAGENSTSSTTSFYNEVSRVSV
jgi:hypothetical protein